MRKNLKRSDWMKKLELPAPKIDAGRPLFFFQIFPQQNNGNIFTPMTPFVLPTPRALLPRPPRHDAASAVMPSDRGTGAPLSEVAAQSTS
jgi:hypothetical protein